MSQEETNNTEHDDVMDQDPDSPLPEYEEEVVENGRNVRRRGIYLLPNILTTCGLLSGFYAILASMSGNFELAAIAIFIAMIFDGLDGRVARITNTQSAFGVEYDSLADMVSFGVAPAIVAFSWALHSLGKFGWAIAFIYVSCAALRLARFNTQVGSADKRFFTGLASPAAAALIAGMIWAGHDSAVEVSTTVAVFAAIITGAAGILMVLNVPYYSFKGLDFKGRVPFVMILLVILVFVVILTDPPKMLLIMGLVYAFSGPVMFALRKTKTKN